MNTQLEQLVIDSKACWRQSNEKLLDFFQTCSAEQEQSITTEQWLEVFREFNGMVSSEVEQFLDLEVVKRHLDEKDEAGVTLLQKHLFHPSLGGREERTAQALYTAGAKIPSNAVEWAINHADAKILQWLHQHEVDITQGGREANLMLYREYAYGMGKEPEAEVVKIMESKILKRNLEKMGNKMEVQAPATEKTEFPKKRFI